MTTEYFRWTEYTWKDPEIDWHKADTLVAGIDVGSVSSQAVVLADDRIYCYCNTRTGSNSPDSAQNALGQAIAETDIKQDDIEFIVGTGYGRVNIPMAKKAITEIACHARGANYMGGPSIKTILDMGGQDLKGIHCDERGKVTQFLMNDKCAAGTGRGMEVMAELLQIPIVDVGDLSL
ncbi:MAG: benzoyl-CoA reductase, bzd-type, subunit Q, partial [Dehalococcoidia bacterium]